MCWEDDIQSAAQDVFEHLGPGLSECIYQKALGENLRLLGYTVESEVIMNVLFHDQVVGFICADIVLDKKICLELKAKVSLNLNDKTQAQSYLRHNSSLSHCILINFPSSEQSVQFELMQQLAK